MPHIRQNTEDLLHLRVSKDLRGRPQCRNPSVHQHNPIRMARDHAEIMRDEEDGEILLRAQLRNDVVKEHQPAPIDARDRLVEQKQVRHGIKREREEHALELPA